MEKKQESSNTLNLTVVSLVALVSLVAVTAMVLNVGGTHAVTQENGIGHISDQNTAGGALYSRSYRTLMRPGNNSNSSINGSGFAMS